MCDHEGLSHTLLHADYSTKANVLHGIEHLGVKSWRLYRYVPNANVVISISSFDALGLPKQGYFAE